MIINRVNQLKMFPVSAQRFAPLLLAGLLSACGGGGSGGGGESEDGGTDGASGAVSSVTPASGATDVARNTTVTATFNEDVLGTSVDDTSFTLSAADSVSGSVSFDGLNNIATFTPDSDLAMMANYTATLTSSITDLSGDSLGDDYSWSFTTADGNWGTASVIDSGDTLVDTNRPSVAHLSNGDTLVVYRKIDESVWANRYVEGSGWGAAEKIGDSSVDFVHIAADSLGNAIVVWKKRDGNKNNLWFNRYVSGSGWEGDARIRSSNGSNHPRIAFDGSGNATLVWYESDDTRFNVWGARYEPNTGWTGAHKLDSEDFGDARDPEVAVNDDGRAVVVWQQFNGARWNIWGKFYIPGKGWFSAVEIEDLSEQDLHPKVAIDNSGYAIAVWEHSGNASAGYKIYASRFDPGQGWGAPKAIEGNANQPRNAVVAMDSEGNAAVVWAQQDSDSEYDLWTNRYEVDSGWGTAELLEYRANKLEVIAGFNLAFDAQGNAIATWIQANGSRNSVNARRYIKGSGWGDTDLVESSTGDIQADSAQGHRSLAIDSQGRATAVWSQSSSGHVGIRSNRFE